MRQRKTKKISPINILIVSTVSIILLLVSLNKASNRVDAQVKADMDKYYATLPKPRMEFSEESETVNMGSYPSISIEIPDPVEYKINGRVFLLTLDQDALKTVIVHEVLEGVKQLLNDKTVEKGQVIIDDNPALDLTPSIQPMGEVDQDYNNVITTEGYIPHNG